ncbi:hypothetical protein [Lysobacter gummosus]|uniref:hypothetical protein n=1 Tax=Lysobacter gummosus TaxID=262324 RepID=UPI003638077D
MEAHPDFRRGRKSGTALASSPCGASINVAPRKQQTEQAPAWCWRTDPGFGYSRSSGIRFRCRDGRRTASRSQSPAGYSACATLTLTPP